MDLRDSWEKLPKFIRSNMMGFSKRVALSYKGSAHTGHDFEDNDFTIASFATSNLITSKIPNRFKFKKTGIVDPYSTKIDKMFDRHKPVLDIDVPCALIPSSTEGHGHLFFDVEMSWGQYQRLLTVLGECGILEAGYVGASIQKGFTAVRLPHVKKDGPLLAGPRKVENND